MFLFFKRQLYLTRRVILNVCQHIFCCQLILNLIKVKKIETSEFVFCDLVSGIYFVNYIYCYMMYIKIFQNYRLEMLFQQEKDNGNHGLLKTFGSILGFQKSEWYPRFTITLQNLKSENERILRPPPCTTIFLQVLFFSGLFI